MTVAPGEEVEWYCPYCDEPNSALRGMQQHITGMTEEKQEGIAGESPDQNTAAINPETGE